MTRSKRQVQRLLDLAAATEVARIEPPPGVDLGCFELVREVGRGAMGVVYEAHDTRLDRRVALKFLGQRLSFAASPVLRERFVREAQAAARLGHPHIAAVYEATPDYIAMQFVEGASLDLWLSTEQRPTEVIVALLRDAARAVQHAHDQGVVHRDLKPSNLLVDDLLAAPQIFVTDFGLAKLEELDSTLSASGDVLGTPGFMSPEQAMGRADVGERSDVYGLGATLYAALAGQAPFAGDDVVSVLRRICEEEPPPLRKRSASEVGADLHTIVHKCLRKEPAERYASAAEFANDLDRWLAGEAIAARPPTVRYRSQKFLQRHRLTLWVAAAVALVGILFVSWQALRARAIEETGRRTIQLASQVENLLVDAEDLFRSGQIGMHEDNLRKAEAMCRKFLADYPLARARLLLARTLRMRRAYAAALAELEQALALEAELYEARFERGLLLVEYINRTPDGGGPDTTLIPFLRRQAVEDLRVVTRQEFTFRMRDRLFGEAELARLTGDEERAKFILLQIAEDLDPVFIPAILVLADLAYKNGDEKAAQKWASRIVDLLNSAGPGYRASPLAGAESFWAPSGMPLFNDEAIAEGSVDAAHVLLRGTVRMERGDLTGAREDFEYTLEKRPSEARAAVGLGQICLTESRVHDEQGRVLQAVAARAEAVTQFEGALVAQPDSGWARLGLGEVRLLQADRMRRAGFAAESAAREVQAERDLLAAEQLGPAPVRVRAKTLREQRRTQR